MYTQTEESSTVDTVTALNTDWTQVSGDVTASEYGATFAQLDTIGDKVYGVNVVEVTNMVEECGSDYDVKRNGGAYVTEVAYCDVDTIEISSMREIMRYSDLSRLAEGTPEYTEEMQVHTQMLQGMAADMHKVERWQGMLTEAQHKQLANITEELDTLTTWYAIPRMVRAEAMHSYGGYSNGQSLTFASLREAMEYHSIPASALWRASEYDALPDDCKVGVRVRRGSLGYHDDSGTYYAEYTQDDGVYQYNLADVTECPNCDHDVSDMDVLETCPVCGGNFEEMLAPKCCECDKPVFKGWQCLDTGDMYCKECVYVIGQ